MTGSTPGLYGAWLQKLAERARGREHKVIFVNAWNEWAEGAFLEPCALWGRSYLEATRAALMS